MVGAIRGPGIPSGKVSWEKHHATDWLPTLVSMATGACCSKCEVVYATSRRHVFLLTPFSLSLSLSHTHYSFSFSVSSSSSFSLSTHLGPTGGGDWKKWIPKSEAPYLLGDGINNWPMLTAGGAPGSSQRDWLLYEAHPGNTGTHDMHHVSVELQLGQPRTPFFPPPLPPPLLLLLLSLLLISSSHVHTLSLSLSLPPP